MPAGSLLDSVIKIVSVYLQGLFSEGWVTSIMFLGVGLVDIQAACLCWVNINDYEVYMFEGWMLHS